LFAALTFVSGVDIFHNTFFVLQILLMDIISQDAIIEYFSLKFLDLLTERSTITSEVVSNSTEAHDVKNSLSQDRLINE